MTLLKSFNSIVSLNGIFLSLRIVLISEITSIIFSKSAINLASNGFVSGQVETIKVSFGVLSAMSCQISSVENGINEYNNTYSVSMSFPETDSTAYSISVYPDKIYYSKDDFYYNEYTFQEIPIKAYGKYADANAGENLSLMNYDIHIGSFFGLTGRIAMFLSVLIGASLPVTGFYIWWGRNNKKKNVK